MFIPKNIIRYLVFAFAFAFGLGFSAIATAADVEAAVVVKPVGNFTAKFNDVEGYAIKTADGFKSGKFSIPWAKLDTGMALRDKHAKDYFNAKEHPNIEVTAAAGKSGKGIAKLKMNGVEKTVKGSYTIRDQLLIAEFPILLSEFNVKNINFKGAGVRDEVTVKMTVPIRDK